MHEARRCDCPAVSISNANSIQNGASGNRCFNGLGEAQTLLKECHPCRDQLEGHDAKEQGIPKMIRPAYSRLALAMLPAIAAPALAQPVQGATGERSRSVIRISVSVAPAFKVERPSAPSGAAGRPAIRAIDQSLRYAVVTQPMGGDSFFEPNGGPSGAGTLVLIVPD